MNTLLRTPGSSIQVGQKLVEIQQKIGAGGFGDVYKVKDVITSSEYALKEVVYSENESLAVKNEILTLSNISHPNVISIIESGDYEDTKGRHMLILTEYCPGGNLNDRLTRESSKEVECKWMRQMAEAVLFLHSRNLVHRDLKPENVLLIANDDIKIADFGSAREFISLKQTGTVQGTVSIYLTYSRCYMNTFIGTPHWMAPEVFPSLQGHGHYSEKADVFSLGVLFLAILERDFIFDPKGKRYYGAFVNVPGEGKVGIGYAMCKCGPAEAVPLQARGSFTLKMIALGALKFEPKDRPSAAVILNRITTFISQNQPFLSIPNSVGTGNLEAQYQELGGGLGTRYPGLVGLSSTNPGVGFGLSSTNPGIGFGFSSTNPGVGFGLSSTNPGVGFGLSSTNPGIGFGFSSTNPGVGFGFSSTNPGVGFGLRSINPGAGFGLRSINPGAGFGLRSINPGAGFGLRSSNPGVGFGFRSTNPGVGFGFRSTNPGVGFGLSSTNPGVGWAWAGT